MEPRALYSVPGKTLFPAFQLILECFIIPVLSNPSLAPLVYFPVLDLSYKWNHRVHSLFAGFFMLIRVVASVKTSFHNVAE